MQTRRSSTANTVFGEVVSGMDVVDKIRRLKSNNGMVENPDKIIKMRVAGDES
jgi:peptidylprolyl isomerase